MLAVLRKKRVVSYLNVCKGMIDEWSSREIMQLLYLQVVFSGSGKAPRR